MSDAPVVHIGENSPENIALKLFFHVLKVENKLLYQDRSADGETADRKWILDTYTECILSVRGIR